MLVPELAIAYHVETSTARPLKKAHHRDYSDLRTGEIPATLDLVGARRGDLLVLDWKTGLKIEHDGRTTWQMRFCGLAAARMFGASDVRVTLAYIGDSYQGTPSVLLDAWDLDEAAQELRDLWRKIHAGPQPPKPGPHCTRDYCPLIGQCEATRAALASLAPTPIERVTRENAAKAWELLPRAEAALKAVKAEILKLASREPIELASGKRLVIVERETESVDSSKAWPVLVEELGANAEACVERATSKAAIERGVGRAQAKHVIAALAKAGAIKTSKWTQIKEV